MLLITRFCTPCFGGENTNETAVGTLAVLATGYANAAALKWGVQSSYNIANYTSTLPGDEIMLTYIVSNLSELGNANGMQTACKRHANGMQTAWYHSQ